MSGGADAARSGATRNAAELRKLGHTLGVGTDRLSMVAGVPAADLRALRKQAAEALFQADRAAFVRVY